MVTLFGRNIVMGLIGVVLYLGAYLAFDLAFMPTHLLGWSVLSMGVGHLVYAFSVLASRAWLRGKEP